jgi:hypothetical protein
MEQQLNRPAELQLIPGNIITLSKQNAKEFHEEMKAMIKETGYGLFEYVEFINFAAKLKDQISGNSQAKIPEDKELIEMIREEVTKYGKTFTTPRGVKFELAETGTAYDFSQCNDSELLALEQQAQEATEKVKARKEFLKTVPSKGLEIHDGDGELYTVYPPSKSSKSSYKVSFPKL